MDPAQQWKRIRSVCATDGAQGKKVYGVQVVCGEIVWRFEDVDASARRVERLVALLNEEQPEPCHWEAIVEDYIEGGA
ncbi:MAG: hypothetical protein E7541_03845 [Ruminococcaceae bacterium]|nr:hypothetical protein [Oscillospiraceae bacterium]